MRLVDDSVCWPFFFSLVHARVHTRLYALQYACKYALVSLLSVVREKPVYSEAHNVVLAEFRDAGTSKLSGDGVEFLKFTWLEAERRRGEALLLLEVPI